MNPCQRRFALALAALFAVSGSSLSPARATGEVISIDARDLDVYDVVRLLASQGGVNLVVDASVPHRNVTFRLQHVRFEEALATLAATNGLESVRVGDVTYLGTPEVMNRRYPGRDRGIETHVFTLRAAVPADVARALSGVLPLGTVIVPDARTQSVIVTGSPETIGRARETLAALDAPASIRTVSVPLRFVRASDVAKTLANALEIQAPATLAVSDEQNAIVLGGPADFVDRAREAIATLDHPGRQVRYDVRVTDLSPQNDSGNTGFVFGGASAGTGGGGPTPGTAVVSFPIKTVAIDATLNALVTQGRAKILARPNISTMNNVPASLLVGEQYPIVYFDARTGTQQVQFVNIGVNLNVTPTIGDDGDVTTDLEADYSQIVGTAAGGFPRIGTRKAQSRLRVRDGETIVIAGLFSDFDTATVTKVPFLGDVPVLGEVFKNRQYSRIKDEVVFLLTPHLVTEANQSDTGLPSLK